MLRPILNVHMCLCVLAQGVFTVGQLCQGGSGAAVTWERAGEGRGSDLNRGTGMEFTMSDLSASIAFA